MSEFISTKFKLHPLLTAQLSYHFTLQVTGNQPSKGYHSHYTAGNHSKHKQRFISKDSYGLWQIIPSSIFFLNINNCNRSLIPVKFQLLCILHYKMDMLSQARLLVSFVTSTSRSFEFFGNKTIFSPRKISVGKDITLIPFDKFRAM